MPYATAIQNIVDELQQTNYFTLLGEGNQTDTLIFDWNKINQLYGLPRQIREDCNELVSISMPNYQFVMVDYGPGTFMLTLMGQTSEPDDDFDLLGPGLLLAVANCTEHLFLAMARFYLILDQKILPPSYSEIEEIRNQDDENDNDNE